MVSIISISDNNNDNNNKEGREFASAVLSGTVIGRTLQDALQSLHREDVEKEVNAEIDANSDNDKDDDDDSQDSATTRPPVAQVLSKTTAATAAPVVKLNDESFAKILGSFRTAIAESEIVKDAAADGAPPALLQGRCDYFKRYQQNWMMAMDHVQLKERPQTFRKRRREDRPSLWDRDNDDHHSQTIDLGNKKVQLLAYGDIA